MESYERFRLSPEEKRKVEENKNFVLYLVKKMFPKISKDDFEDKVQEGMIGLIKAVKTFDESKSKFGTYASKCIKNEILKNRENDQKYSRNISIDAQVEQDDGSRISIANILKDAQNSHIQEDIENKEQIQSALSIILNQFPTREKVIMLLNVAGTRQIDIGKLMRIPQSYVSRIIKRWTEVLKQRSQKYSKKDFVREYFEVTVDKIITISFPFEDIKTFDICLDRILLKLKEMEQIATFNVNRSGKMVTIHLPMERDAFIMLALLIDEMSTL